MVITASVDVLELSRLVVMPLGVLSFEKKALDLVGSVEGVTLLLVELVGVTLQDAANVASVRRAVLVDDVPEDQHLPGAENVRWSPIECAPIHSQAQVALALGSKAANR